MLKTFYGNQKSLKNFEGYKTKINYWQKNIGIKNNKGKSIYIEDLNSNKFDNGIFDKNTKKDGYIYYGGNKMFKTRNRNFLPPNISSKIKSQKLLSKNINNNDTNFKKFRNQPSRNILLIDNLHKKIKSNFNKENISQNYFPFIIKNLKEKEAIKIKANILNNTNMKSKDDLNIFHKNFQDFFKNKYKNLNKKAFKEKKLFNKKLLKKNYSQEEINKNNMFSGINEKDNTNNNYFHIFKIKEEKTNKKYEYDNKSSERKNGIVNNFVNALNNIKYRSNDIFSNPLRKNCSYISSKNMKIEENSDINNTYKDNSNIKLNNYKTSENFYAQKFNKKSKLTQIINKAIERNIKVGEARSSSSFINFGTIYLNKRTEKKNNFYSDKSSTKYNKYYNHFENEKKNNFLNLYLKECHKWEKHENFWINIKNNNYNEKEKCIILPPNDEDIIISLYVNMYGKKIKKDENDILKLCLNDDISNPRNEIKKWKIIYKKCILRWHPDKLFPLLNELNIIDNNIINELKRRSTLIINNISILYQNIIEILNKILQSKNKKE